jgi:hypothetical protein
LSENEFDRPMRNSVNGGERRDRFAGRKPRVDSIKKFMAQISPALKTSSL